MLPLRNHNQTSTTQVLQKTSLALVLALSTSLGAESHTFENGITASNFTTQTSGKTEIIFGENASFSEYPTGGQISINNTITTIKNLDISNLGKSIPSGTDYPYLSFQNSTQTNATIHNYGGTGTHAGRDSSWVLRVYQNKTNLTVYNHSNAVWKETIGGSGNETTGNLTVFNGKNATMDFSSGYGITGGEKAQLAINNEGKIIGSTQTVNGYTITVKGSTNNALTNKGSINGIILAGDDNKTDDTSAKLTITNSGSIISNRTDKAGGAIEVTGTATIINEKGGVITGGILGANFFQGGNPNGTGTLIITNAGTINEGDNGKYGIYVKGNDNNTIDNQKTGVINGTITLAGGTTKITNAGTIQGNLIFQGSGTKVTLTNTGKGIINGVLNFGSGTTTNTEVTLTQNFAVSLKSRTNYNTNGALKITGTQGTLKLGGADTTAQPLAQGVTPNATQTGSAFELYLGEGFELGEYYDLSKFINKQNGSGVTIKDANNNDISTDLANYLKGNIYLPDDTYVLHFKGNLFKADFETTKSPLALSAFQMINAFTSQTTRTQNLLDSVFDSMTMGDYLKAQMTQTTERQKEGATNENSQSDEFILRHIQAENSWVVYATPYYANSSFNLEGFDPTSGYSAGLISGATKMFENGILAGVHVGFDYQSVGKTTNELQISNKALTFGVHTKIPFKQYDFSYTSLIPFIKAQMTGLLSLNDYAFETSRSDSVTAGGMSVGVWGGVDLPTGYGYVTPEMGLIQEVIALPDITLNDSNFKDQSIGKHTLAPFYLVAQAKYAKDFNVSDVVLLPMLKVGIRTALNTEIKSLVKGSSGFKNNGNYVINHLDTIMGTMETGLEVKFKENILINATYLGEFGSQISTHSVGFKVGYVF
ncbi:hypothetical protein BBW65_07605 [Helicobacter enhydrae]|uniref:Autotransporter domain-containing protein n=1 Tax=Helicobacter enhydrae TaxID=222136 RepID=A0A1B1U7F0_9HELI|nr:hypothetical protein [Helicobacter enhydrae]ANV98670.1 hypothetical protein BBW65_07605 [Helicobacter enhydrae]